MRRSLAVLLLAALAAGLAGTPANGFNQPPLNLGLTDILDGALPGPGTYFTQYIQAYDAGDFKDGSGNNIPGDPDVANLLAMNQFVHVYKYQLLGASLGVDVLLPVVAISGGGTVGSPGPPVSSNPAVLGDLVVGPFLQWFDTKLLGRPFLHRLELDFILPTGQYDSKYLINPGANIWTIEPYYAFTWFLTDKLSTSWRLMYDFNMENDDPFDGFKAQGVNEIQAGQAFHFNYSFEYELFKNFRGAVAGYYLVQTTDDEFNGQGVSDSKEQVFAIGPALHWIVSPNFSMGLKTAWEMGTENRPEGNRTTFRWTYKF